jgi:hypothetical protein
MLTPAGTYHSKPGAGPRTLHFHPNGHTAYSINELDSTVDILEWNKKDGSLTLVKTIDLLPADYHGPTGACDTVISAMENRSISPIASTISSIVFLLTRNRRPDSHRPQQLRRQDPAQLHARPHRALDAGSQPDLKPVERLRAQPRDRSAGRRVQELCGGYAHVHFICMNQSNGTGYWNRATPL